MEPMTLGSPVGSPTSPSPYLPGFLMGDPMPQPSSPSKTPRQVHFAPSLSTTAGSLTPAPGSASLNDSLSRFHKNQREKSGGPPTVGLFDTLEVSTSALGSEPTTSAQQSTPLAQPLVQQPGSAATPTQYSMSVEESERWVTVFGFPPAAASAIVGQFSQVGHIVEHRFPGQGNWVNICYASKLDARRALAYNGKILGGHTMIGVVPCQDYSLKSTKWNSREPKYYGMMAIRPPSDWLIRPHFSGCVHPGSALKDMTNMISSSGTPTTPKTPQMSRLSHRRLVTSPSPSPYLPSPRGSRPMGIASPSDNEVTGSQNTPTKSSSFVTKAVDFVFGW